MYVASLGRHVGGRPHAGRRSTKRSRCYSGPPASMASDRPSASLTRYLIDCRLSTYQHLMCARPDDVTGLLRTSIVRRRFTRRSMTCTNTNVAYVIALYQAYAKNVIRLATYIDDDVNKTTSFEKSTAIYIYIYSCSQYL